MGGLSYLWSPLTPGYYDLSAGASLILVALVLAIIHGARTSGVASVAFGVVSLVLILAKWPAVSVVAILLVATAVLLAPSGFSSVLRHLAFSIAGFVAAIALVHVAVFPLDEALEALVTVTRSMASSSHGVHDLAAGYLRSTGRLLVGGAVIALPAALAYLYWTRTATAGAPARRGAGLFSAAMSLILLAPVVLGWRGGAENGRAALASAVAAMLVGLLAAVMRSRGQDPENRFRGDGPVLVVLVLVPVGQAIGTNVPLLYVAGNCLAMWAAAVMLLGTREGLPPPARVAVTGSLALAAVLVAAIASSATLLTPFRTSGYRASTVAVPQLGGIRVDAGTAREFAAFVDAVDPYVDAGSTPMLTVHNDQGLVYLVGGVPIGSLLPAADSQESAAAILTRACRDGRVDPDVAPVVLLYGPLHDALAQALRDCGHDVDRELRLLPVPGGPEGLEVLVPSQ